MKDREISRLVLINIGLFFAIILCAVFFFWLHGTFASAPGGAAETASDSLVRFAPTTRSPEAASAASDKNNLSPKSISPAPSTFKHFTYENGVTLPVSGKCSTEYFVVLIFPVAIDYRNNPMAFNFNTAYPCTAGTDFSQVINLDNLHLPAGSSYYVIIADEKNSGTWYNPR